jgi:hypothetical protein
MSVQYPGCSSIEHRLAVWSLLLGDEAQAVVEFTGYSGRTHSAAGSQSDVAMGSTAVPVGKQ